MPGYQTTLLSITAFAFLTLTGCKVDQKAEVDLYRDVLKGRISETSPYVPDEPLTLSRSMRLANQNNEQVALRGEDYVQALITKNRVAAAFLPTVSFQPSFTIEQRAREDASTSTGPGSTGIGQGTNSNNFTSSTSLGSGGFQNVGQTAQRLEAPVVGSINLFRGGGDIANLESAEAAIEQRRLLLLDAQSAVLLNVAQVYYQVLRSERSVDVLKNSVRLQEARLKDVQEQFRNELATRLSVAQSRAQVDGTRATLIQAQSDVVNGRHTLAALLGVDSVNGPLSNAYNIPEPQQRPTLESLEASALAQREDLRAATAAITAARAAVDVAFAQYYPSVSLNVTGFLYREFFADASKWNAILSANLPLFSAGLIEADVRAAWSRLRQAALYESSIRRQVLRDVRVAYNNLLTSEARLREYDDQVKAAQEALEQAQNAFNNSLAINLDVLVAQDQVLNAELLLTGARFDRTVFYLDLIRAVGSLTDVTADPTATQPATAPTIMPSATAPTR